MATLKPETEFSAYLSVAKASVDRWGSALRTASALAAAEFCQDRKVEAVALLESATSQTNGFAGYMVAHLLTLACRWCELGSPEQARQLGLMGKSRTHAQGVRDPGFRAERINLVDQFEKWFDEALPAWPEVAARLRSTPDADTRRLFKDLVSARWCAAALWKDWDQLILAVLADATALDCIFGRFFGEVIRRHRGGVHLFPDDELLEAVKICRDIIGTSRPWEVGAPAYG